MSHNDAACSVRRHREGAECGRCMRHVRVLCKTCVEYDALRAAARHQASSAGPLARVTTPPVVDSSASNSMAAACRSVSCGERVPCARVDGCSRRTITRIQVWSVDRIDLVRRRCPLIKVMMVPAACESRCRCVSNTSCKEPFCQLPRARICGTCCPCCPTCSPAYKRSLLGRIIWPGGAFPSQLAGPASVGRLPRALAPRPDSTDVHAMSSTWANTWGAVMHTAWSASSS
jgi:hypothetical protein